MTRKQQKNLGYLFLVTGVSLLALGLYFRHQLHKDILKTPPPSKKDLEKVAREEGISTIAGVILIAMGVSTSMK